MRKSAPRPLSMALERFTTKLAPATTLARVQEVWEQAVGAVIATAAQPVGEREGVLTVQCSAAVWSQELDLMATELIGRLNASLGDELLHGLRCRVL